MIEIIYALLAVAFILYVKVNFSVVSKWETPILVIVISFMLALMGIFGPKYNRYFVFIYTFIISIYLISQDIYHKAFNQYYRFNTAISLFKEVTQVKSSILELIELKHVLPLVFLFVMNVAFVVVYFLFQRKMYKSINQKTRLLSLLWIIPLVLQINSFSGMLDDAMHQEDIFQLNKTDYYIYNVIPNTNQFVEKFGVMTFGYRDIVSFYERDVVSESSRDEIEEFMNSREPQKDNAMTGIFEGKNIIMVQAESFMDVAIDSELTPLLYKMKHEGINIQNFNTPELPGSTSDTEFMSNTSLIPNSEGYAICYKYPYNTYKTTLASIFNSIGYRTLAFHNNYGQYYNRDVLFPNFGYDEFFDCTDLGLEDGMGDKKVMKVMKWIMVQSQGKYLAYWITYSGHQPYNLDSFGVSEENVERIKAKYPNIDESYVAYLAKNMDLDQSLTSLVESLECEGKLDDVVFVFYGDHIAKGLDFKSEIYYDQAGIEQRQDAIYTDLFIYNSATEGFEYEKVSTTLDLLPTIANLWNIDIDTQTIMGRDIFDPEYKGFYFSEWKPWETDNYVYDFIDDELTMKTEYSESLAKEEMNYYLNMKEIAKKILKLDYFKD